MFVSRELPEVIEEAEIRPADGGSVHLPELIADLFGGSRSDARRHLASGAVKLDGEPLATHVLDLPGGDLDGRVLQVGKRRFRRLRLV